MSNLLFEIRNRVRFFILLIILLVSLIILFIEILVCSELSRANVSLTGLISNEVEGEYFSSYDNISGDISGFTLNLNVMSR